MPSLATLRAAGPADSTFVLVTPPPSPAETGSITRAGGAFGRRVVVLVYPATLASLGTEAAAELDGRATAARLSFVRAGWEVLVIGPEGSLKDTWQRIRMKRREALASRS